MTPLPRFVAREVRAAIAREGYTQKQLSEVIGVNQSGVSARFRGRVEFTLSELEAVANWLNISVDAFVRREGLEPPTRWLRDIGVRRQRKPHIVPPPVVVDVAA